MDVWFANYDGYLWMTAAPHGEPPTVDPLRVTDGIASALKFVRQKGNKIVEVGICPPDMLGLE